MQRLDERGDSERGDDVRDKRGKHEHERRGAFDGGLGVLAERLAVLYQYDDSQRRQRDGARGEHDDKQRPGRDIRVDYVAAVLKPDNG